LDTSNELVDTTFKYPNGYPTKEQVISAMQKLGMKTSDTIVLYCQPHMYSSMTRVYHILDSYGFSDVSILDGGLLKFQQDGYPTTPGVDYTGPHSEIKDLKDPSENLIKIDEIVEFALGKKPNMQLIDARGEESFNGRDPSLPDGCRQGHVPGAINIPADSLVNDDDTFKKYPELVKIFESHGVDRNKDIVVMCKTGVSATVVNQALIFAQFSGMRLYDGSWTEYGSNDTPIASVAPSYPMYVQPTAFPTPQFIVLPTGEQYMMIPVNNNDHLPVYKL
jgi:thiosulfate/3-mercaptopyruvate sulfurtransferase